MPMPASSRASGSVCMDADARGATWMCSNSPRQGIWSSLHLRTTRTKSVGTELKIRTLCLSDRDPLPCHPHHRFAHFLEDVDYKHTATREEGTMAAETANPSQIIEVAEIAWESLTPTIKAKILWSDPATKRRAQLTRFEPGASLSMHRHVGDELLYVIEGSISDEHGITTSGNVGYRPNGCVHSVISKNGATVLAIVTGGIEPASDIAGAPPSQNFNLSEIAWVDAMPGVRQKPIWQDKETKRRVALARFDPGAQLPRHKH